MNSHETPVACLGLEGVRELDNLQRAGAIERKAHLFENGRTWSVWLSPDATVVELAVIMTGLRAQGINIQAEHMGNGAFALFPAIPGTAAPTADVLARIMSDPLPQRLPTLIARHRAEERVR